MRGLIIKKQADIFYVEILPEKTSAKNTLKMLKNAERTAKNTEKTEKIAKNTQKQLQVGNVLACTARKTLKRDGLFVGDFVWLDEDGAICKIEERKNLLIRPPMANLDKIFIVTAPIPKPDFYTVDKLIVFALLNHIQPYLFVNKTDLNPDLCQQIEKRYKKIVKTALFSTFDDSVLKIKQQIKGICALAGQSAVGKSSIINALKNSAVAKVGTFSKKIERGKQTTRVVELYKFGEGAFLADTAGFSKLDESLLAISEQDLKNYFTDFLPFAKNCKYSSCQHTVDKNDQERYQNYLKLHQTLKNIKKY